jgi:gamma-glutamyltranspeptidase/glutathione hydrolase
MLRVAMTTCRSVILLLALMFSSFFCSSVLVAGPSHIEPAAISGRQRSVVASGTGMVVSATSLSSEVGAKVLAKGGNAVDAAVATAFALAVTWPEAGNIGGGGFFLVKMPGDAVRVLDSREVAPSAASRSMYLDESGNVRPGDSTVGWRAVAVPGTVRGLYMLHQKYGKLPWKQVVEPAEHLAAKGITVDSDLARSISGQAEKLARFESTRQIFLRWGEGANLAPPIGATLVQRDLAKTLRAIREQGDKGFYQGAVARAFDQAKAQTKGAAMISAADLANYSAVWREPLVASFADKVIYTMPPPSSGGGALIAMIKMLQKYGTGSLAKLTGWDADQINLLAHIMKFAFRDRADFYGDPDFSNVPLGTLLSDEGAKFAAERIQKALELGVISAEAVKTWTSVSATDQAPSSSGSGQTSERKSENTTHFSVADGRGGWVSCTATLNTSFGSWVVLPGTGVVLNNEMDDFTAKPGSPNVYGLIQSEANAIAPGKRPLSSMTPTLVALPAVQNGAEPRIMAAIGSPGGPTIINQVFLILIDLLIKNRDPQSAVSTPRFHHQWMPDRIFLEPAQFSMDTIKILQKMGHSLETRAVPMGAAHIIVENDGIFEAGVDPRLGGAAAFP